MAVIEVQNNTENTQKQYKGRMGYFSSMATGGLLGYALKWAIPVTSSEKSDLNYKKDLADIKRNAWQARVNEIESIRISKPKLDGADEFIRMHDSGKLIHAEIIKLDEPLSEKLMILLTRVNNAAKNAKTKGRENLKTLTKKIRPTEIFILTGAIISFLVALVNNISKRVPLSSEYID